MGRKGNRFAVCFAVAAFSLTAAKASAATIATYNFQGNTNATQGGVPALSIILDGGAASSAFMNDTVFGSTRQVLQLTGVAPTDAGLQFNDSGALLPSNNYSAEMMFDFTQNSASGWRKILDSTNRTPDSGFYVSPSNFLDVFPDSPAGTTTWTTNAYHDVVLTVSSSGSVSAYLDGHLELTVASTTVMNIDASNLLSFFVDDSATGHNEFSSSKVARIQLYNQVLTQQDVSFLWNGGNPFGAAQVPEPSTWTALTGGLIALIGWKLRGHRTYTL